MSRQILIVDDDDRFRRSVKFAFKSGGYSLFEASNVQQAINIVNREANIRVVILGLSLAGSKGTDFLEYIKDESSRYRVIILTGHEEMLAAEIAREYNVFNYLPKTSNSSVQSIRFSVDQAFNDIERDFLSGKTNRLLEIQERINSNQELGEILEAICRSVRELVGGYTCHIRLYDFTKGDFAIAAFSGPSEEMRDIFRSPRARGQFFSGVVAEEKNSILLDDLEHDEGFVTFKKKTLNSVDVTESTRQYFNTIRSAYVVPLFTNTFGADVDGILNISSDSVAYFTHQRRKIVDEFVTQATLAVTKDWLQHKRLEAIEDYRGIGRMLSEVSEQFTSSDILARICDVVIDGISKIVRPETVAVFLFNDRTSRLEKVAELRGDERVFNSEESYAPGQSLTGAVYERGRTIRLPDPQRGILTTPTKDPRYDVANISVNLETTPSGRIEHYLGVPISIGDHKLGVLTAINKKSGYYEVVDVKTHQLSLLARGFSDDCQNLLQITANHLAIAIRNAQLINEFSWQIEQLQSLNEVGRLISSEINIDDLLSLIIKQTAKVMQAEICMLFLKDEAGARITLAQCYGLSMPESAFFEIGEGLTGRVALDGMPVLKHGGGGNNGKYDWVILQYLRERYGRERNIESLMAVPIVAKGRILGVIKVINKLGDRVQYGADDLRFFEIFASYVGVAIENAQIYDLTNRKLAIAERNATLSLLVRSVAHEINNTSGLIPVNVQAIRAAFADSGNSVSEILPSIGEMLDVIEDAATQAVDFANEIAGFSAGRMGNGRVTDINEVITKAIALFRPEIERNRRFEKILLDARLSDKPIYCFLYEAPFIQIVRNIALNAYQAMEGKGGGVLTIRTSEAPLSRLARIELTDTGSGIREDDIARIFDPDFTTKERGNGMGLWLVQNHLDRIGGVITVNSKLHEGTTFILEIPLDLSST